MNISVLHTVSFSKDLLLTIWVPLSFAVAGSDFPFHKIVVWMPTAHLAGLRFMVDLTRDEGTHVVYKCYPSFWSGHVLLQLVTSLHRCRELVTNHLAIAMSLGNSIVGVQGLWKIRDIDNSYMQY